MIQTEHITKSFGRTHILSGISLHVRDRELVAYLGPNGAGKTTTVRILSGQARADGGTVKLAGRNLTEHPLEAKALCGVVSQHLNLDAELSVRERPMFHCPAFFGTLKHGVSCWRGPYCINPAYSFWTNPR